MMHIFMWLFVNDYGSIGLISGLLLVLIGILLLCFSLYFLLILMCLIEKTCLFKLFKAILCSIIITSFIFFEYFLIYTGDKNFTKSHASLIPQYGTQSQKEILSICIQDRRKNGLTEEDKTNIAYAIDDIMEMCQKKYDKIEEKHEQELKHRKFLLKNKEILDSLDKILIEQGAK